EVATVFGKLGRAETATDPAPMSMAETTVRLRPREEWPRRGHPGWMAHWAPPGLRTVWPWGWVQERPDTPDELLSRLEQASRLPGGGGRGPAPARARLDGAATGIRPAVGLRIRGPDAGRLEALAERAGPLLEGVAGPGSAFMASGGGETRLEFGVRPDELARR